MTASTGSTEQISDQPGVAAAGVERPTRAATDVPPGPVPRWRDALLVATVTAMLALIPLLFNRRFYFYDDTQAAGWGIWYHTGQRLRTGDFAFLDLHTWPSGNFWAEGQWGFLSPFSMLLGLGSSLVGDLGLYSTVVKILFLCFTGVGAYLLATTVGASRFHAILVGFLAPMAGCVVYLDTSSWFSGLQAWGWLIWLWLSLLKLQRDEWGYLPAAGFIFLLATVGYAHATMMCGFLIGAFLLYAIAVRAWRLAGRFLVLGLYTLIVTAPVLLPGILTAPVTTRNTAAIANSGFFGPDLSDAGMATTLTGGFDLANFTGPMSWQPLMYVAWALPLLWIGWRSRNHDWRVLGPTLIFTGLVCLYIFGPTEFGPVRWPVRVQPYLALAVLIALVSSSHSGARRPRLGPDTAAVLLALPLFGAWMAFADSPTDWRRDLEGLLIVALGLLTVWWLSARGSSTRQILAVAIGVTVAATGFQRWTYPAPALPDWGLPTSVQSLQEPLKGVQGDTLVVGTKEIPELTSMWTESSLANAWLVNPSTVQNAYQIISFRAYAELLGSNYLGLNGPGALDTLFDTVPGTKVPWVNAFGLSNLQVWRPSYPDRDLESAPQGWSLSDSGQKTVLWTRDGEVPDVGDVIESSPGLTVETVANTSDRLTLRVVNTASQPGRIILSRLAWPGYSVDGPAQLVDPTAGMLLTVEVPGGSAASEVDISFEPPGLRLGLWLLSLGTLLVLILELVRRRSRRKGRAAVDTDRPH